MVIVSMTGTLQRGTMVGPYRIRQLVGQGGMGAVYLARDTRLGRRVALKIVRPERTNERSVAAFLDEARVTARFSHPHIVQVYDVGEYEGVPYLALEYIEGRTLRQGLQGGRMPQRRALRVGYEIATALAEAHREGVSHRDLKPENVLLADDGRARVVDFGLAKAVDTDLEVPAGGNSGLAGTPAYLSPEQWTRAQSSTASDIWALGVTLFEMLLGSHPFGSDSAESRGGNAMQWAICGSGELAPQLPSDEFADGVTQLVADCLERDPYDRPEASEVAERLDRLLRGREEQGSDACPFRGLLAFTEDDRSVFFGRDAEIALAVERLRTEATLSIVGPSGTGKSSYAFAGVVPRLREQRHQVVISMRPGRDPIGTLASRLVASESSTLASIPASLETLDYALDGPLEMPDLAPALSRPNAQIIGDRLRSTPTALSTLLLDLAASRRASVLLVVDQLEELETLTQSATDRAAFLQAICTAAEDPQEPVRVLLTVRDDFLGRLATTPEAARALGRVLVLRPMDREALRASIRRPLEATNHWFDDDALPGLMLDEVAGAAAALPMLQFTARALWDRRDREARLLRMADYREIGGVGGALIQHADDVLSTLGTTQLDCARLLLLRLITPDGTRRIPRWDELLDGLPEAAPAVLARLVQSRLLTVREGAGGREVELAHESLVLTWSRLRKWASEARDEVRALFELEEAARLWDKRGRRGDDVWVDESVGDLSQMAQTTDLALSSRARAFLTASVAARAGRLRLRRTLIAVGVVGLCLITTASVLTALQFSRERQVAVAMAARAETSRAEALVSGARAALVSGEPLVAAAKLRAGLEIRDSPAARGLWWQMSNSAEVWRSEGELASYGATLSPDRNEVVVAHDGGLVRIYDLWTGSFRTFRTDPIDLGRAALSPDAGALAALDYEGNLWTWNTAGGEPTRREGAQGGWAPRQLWFDDDEIIGLYIGFEDRQMRLVRWPVDGGAARTEPLGAAGSVARSPDGKRLVKLPLGDSRIEWWNDGEPEPSWVSTTIAGDVPCFDDSGQRLVVVGPEIIVLDGHSGDELSRFEGVPARYARRVMVRGDQLTVTGRHGGWMRFDLTDGRLLLTRPPEGAGIYVGDATLGVDDLLFTMAQLSLSVYRAGVAPRTSLRRGHQGKVEGLDVAPDGRILSGAVDGAVRVWTPEGDGRVLSPAADDFDVYYLRVSPDGQHVAVGGSGGQAYLARLDDGARPVVLQLEDDVMGLAFDGPDRLYTADWQGDLVSWDLSEAWKGRAATPLQRWNYNTSLRDVAVTGGVVATTGLDGLLHLGPPGQRAVAAHTSDVHTLVAGGGFLVTGSFDGEARLWTREGEAVSRQKSHSTTRPSLNRDGTIWAWADTDGVQVQDIATGDTRRMWVNIPGNALALDASGERLYGADDHGNLRSWTTADGLPRWRGVALISDPPRGLTHRGWRNLQDSEPVEGPAVPPLDAVMAQVHGDEGCWVSPDGDLVQLSGGEREQTPVPRPRWLGAQDGRCAVVGDGGFSVFRGGTLRRVDASVRWARATSDGWITLGDEIVIRDLDGAPLHSHPTPPEATAAHPLGDELLIGYRDGLVEVWRDGQPTPDRALSSPIRAPIDGFLEGPAGTLVVSQASGEVSLWEPTAGTLLVDVKLHGPVAHWRLEDGQLSLLTALGDGAVLDLSVFSQPWCEVLSDLSDAYRVRWVNEHVARASLMSCDPE